MYVMTINIESTLIKDSCIGNTSAISIQIKYTSIERAYIRNIYSRYFIENIEPNILAELGVMLACLEVNNYSFLLSIRLKYKKFEFKK